MRAHGSVLQLSLLIVLAGLWLPMQAALAESPTEVMAQVDTNRKAEIDRLIKEGKELRSEGSAESLLTGGDAPQATSVEVNNDGTVRLTSTGNEVSPEALPGSITITGLIDTSAGGGMGAGQILAQGESIRLFKATLDASGPTELSTNIKLTSRLGVDQIISQDSVFLRGGPGEQNGIGPGAESSSSTSIQQIAPRDLGGSRIDIRNVTSIQQRASSSASIQQIAPRDLGGNRIDADNLKSTQQRASTVNRIIDKTLKLNSNKTGDPPQKKVCSGYTQSKILDVAAAVCLTDLLYDNHSL